MWCALLLDCKAEDGALRGSQHSIAMTLRPGLTICCQCAGAKQQEAAASGTAASKPTGAEASSSKRDEAVQFAPAREKPKEAAIKADKAPPKAAPARTPAQDSTKAAGTQGRGGAKAARKQPVVEASSDDDF